MAHIDLTGDYKFSVERTDDEPGDIVDKIYRPKGITDAASSG